MTRAELQSVLRSAGVHTSGWMLLDNEFEPVSLERVRAIAQACLDSLPSELVTWREVGGGKSVRVPLWVAEAGDCETHSIVLWAWAMVGNWLKAVREGKRGGLALGFLVYVAQPKPGNTRQGHHAIVWFVDHARQVRFYEFGDNSETTLSSDELFTVSYGFAA